MRNLFLHSPHSSIRSSTGTKEPLLKRKPQGLSSLEVWERAISRTNPFQSERCLMLRQYMF